MFWEAHHVVLVAVLMMSSLLNIAFLLPIPLRAFFANPAGEDTHEHGRIREAPVACLIAIVVSVAGTLVLFFAPDAIIDFLTPIVK